MDKLTPGGTLALLVSAGCDIAGLLGAGGHWPLDDDEQRKLQKDFDRVAKLTKTRRAKLFYKTLEKWAPGTVLAATLGVIMVPRVMLTLQQRKRAQQNNATPQPVTREHGGHVAEPVAAAPIEPIRHVDGNASAGNVPADSERDGTTGRAPAVFREMFEHGH